MSGQVNEGSHREKVAVVASRWHGLTACSSDRLCWTLWLPGWSWF